MDFLHITQWAASAIWVVMIYIIQRDRTENERRFSDAERRMKDLQMDVDKEIDRRVADMDRRVTEIHMRMERAHEKITALTERLHGAQRKP